MSYPEGMTQNAMTNAHLESGLAPGWVEPAWVQQPFEKEDEHNAFRCFVSLPKRQRNLQEVAIHCNMPRDQVLELSLAHHWQHRIQKYDEFVSAGHRSLLDESNRDRAAKQLSVVEKGLEVANREYDNLLAQQRKLDAQGANVTLLKPAELMALTNGLIKLERLITGEVTERTGEEYDLSALSTDELVLWKQLMAKVKVR